MSCTVYYKGTLKDGYCQSDIIKIINGHMMSINAELKQHDDTIIIDFMLGNSEPIVFSFKNKKIDGFCKWNGEQPEELLAIFDMLFEMKPLFRSLKVDDDEGVWDNYIIQKKPCRIKLRTLNPNEWAILERIYANDKCSLNEVEKLIIDQSRFHPHSEALLRIIVQDFIKVMGIESIGDFDPQTIVDYVNILKFSGKDSYKEDSQIFRFLFSGMLIKIWISNAFAYKNMGVVKGLSEDIRGLMSSKYAAIIGIESIFLNKHSGIANSKHVEMKKFAAKYYKTSAMGNVIVIDKPERELEIFFSMMDYLGFSYLGCVEKR